MKGLTEKAIREAFRTLPYENWCEGILRLIEDRAEAGARDLLPKGALGALFCARKDMQEAGQERPRVCIDSTTHQREGA